MRSVFGIVPVLLFAGGLVAMAGKPPKPAKTEPPSSPPAVWTDSTNAPRAVLLDSGAVYFKSCGVCHGYNGRGGRGPTLANSDYVQGDRARLIHTVLAGVSQPIRVNGVRWKTGEMLGWAETWPDFKIAAVLTYIRAALNDSLVISCIPEDYETGTWASCEKAARTASAIAIDSVSVSEVGVVRATLKLHTK
jgi:mono/diheme cytochrome c family protein